MENAPDIKPKEPDKKPVKKEDAFIHHKLAAEKIHPPGSDSLIGFDNWNRLYGTLYTI